MKAVLAMFIYCFSLSLLSDWYKKSLKPWAKIKFSSFFRYDAYGKTNTPYWLLLYCYDKAPSPWQLIEGRVYLAYSSRWKKKACHGEESWEQAGMAGSWVLWFSKARMKQREAIERVRCTSNDEIARAILCHQLGTKCSRAWGYGGQFYSNHHTLSHSFLEVLCLNNVILKNTRIS